ncbi:MAG: hypothetical protein JHC95_10980 [Solirubrobacteraceae bacterium]|nr:hypothetical protein [Solirubrobacteraceae bacterium]
MNLITRTLSALGALLLVVGLATAPALAHGGGKGKGNGSTHGVVLAHVDADTFVVANHGGQLKDIDATAPLPAVGSVVKVKARRGVAKRIRVVGTATSAKVSGTVSAVTADHFTVADKHDDGAAVSIAFAAPIAAPALGAKVKVTVAISGANLTATEVKVKGRGTTEVEGLITAVDPTARTLTVTPEGGGTPVVIAVPTAFDITKFTVGATVELKVLLLADGTHVLAGAKRDHGQDDEDDDGHDKQRGRGHDDDRNGRGRG